MTEDHVLSILTGFIAGCAVVVVWALIVLATMLTFSIKTTPDWLLGAALFVGLATWAVTAVYSYRRL